MVSGWRIGETDGRGKIGKKKNWRGKMGGRKKKEINTASPLRRIKNPLILRRTFLKPGNMTLTPVLSFEHPLAKTPFFPNVMSARFGACRCMAVSFGMRLRSPMSTCQSPMVSVAESFEWALLQMNPADHFYQGEEKSGIKLLAMVDSLGHNLAAGRRFPVHSGCSFENVDVKS